MTSPSLTSLSSITRLNLKPPLSSSSTFLSSLPNLKPTYLRNQKRSQRKIRNRTSSCRAELAHDAPFAIAIGTCMLNSLVFPVTAGPDEDSDSGFSSTDARFAVMAIISFIPYFNWLGWVFAWLDSGRRRYAVYSLVYLAPYLRSNLSLSPDDSWLPIASIVLGIVHVQLEVSIRNGDLQGFQLFSKSANHLSSMTRNKNNSKGHQETSEGRKEENMNLPPAEEQSRNETRRWGVPKKPVGDGEHSNDDWDREHLNDDWDDDVKRR